jgi:hypothetical protein
MIKGLTPCRVRTLPHLGKTTLAGLEPATLRFEVLRAIHCATGPDMLWFLGGSNPRLLM